jgi:hypothetical protein
MIDQPTVDTLLQRVDALGRELELLRRDLLRTAASAAISSPAPGQQVQPWWFQSNPCRWFAGRRRPTPASAKGTVISLQYGYSAFDGWASLFRQNDAGTTA